MLLLCVTVDLCGMQCIIVSYDDTCKRLHSTCTQDLDTCIIFVIQYRRGYSPT